ncbi:uncharacterized protein LOC142239949 [Haematobia irritans]|uniref:uncharacterized protein LOC142239949 n=1 Tax=Haematobia irritans TaxID=7368 RepID=UPI003F50B33C
MVKIIESVYQKTESAVWTGDELSEYFNTNSGVKQGCLLSPLLFALYINDLHDILGGGVAIEEIRVKILLYAYDIVILAEDKESYCNKWNLVVNLSKSKIMVFRNGGRLSSQEKWTLNNQPIEIVSEYNYLGVILTPQMNFTKHIEARNLQAKNAINMTWKNFLGKLSISLEQKWNLFKAVCRSIQSYGAQVWGFSYYDEVDKLQRFFIKKLLRLPDSAPNYAVALETGLEEGHIYMMQMHLKYIMRTKFKYTAERLPHQLTRKVIQKNLCWANQINTIIDQLDMPLINENMSLNSWNTMMANLVEHMIMKNRSMSILRAQQSTTRIYRYLDYSRSHLYFGGSYTVDDISWIIKARCDLILLNANPYIPNPNGNDQCTLCNMNQKETLQHFLGVCPFLSEIRVLYFRRNPLNEDNIISILDGREVEDWRNLIGYLKAALRYRDLIIREFS